MRLDTRIAWRTGTILAIATVAVVSTITLAPYVDSVDGSVPSARIATSAGLEPQTMPENVSRLAANAAVAMRPTTQAWAARPRKLPRGYFAVAAAHPAGDLSASTVELWEGGDRPLTYVLGAELANGAIVKAISADRITLERGDQSLVLPTGEAVVDALASADASDRVLARIAGERIAEPEASASADGPAILTVPQFRGAALAGVEVFPGDDGTLFAELGLHAGDVVLSIEGAALSDQLLVQKQLSSLAPGQSLAVTLRRSGEQLRMVLYRSPPPAT